MTTQPTLYVRHTQAGGWWLLILQTGDQLSQIGRAASRAEAIEERDRLVAANGWAVELEVARYNPERLSTWYARCPHCGLVGPASSADYAIHGPTDNTVDWSYPATLGCGQCGGKHQIGEADLLDRDTDHTCPRSGCGHVSPVPAEAAEVVCLQCHLFAPGPAVRRDSAVAAHQRQVQTDHIREMQGRVLAAKAGWSR